MLKKRGFTLLEVLLATLIISVGMIALIWAFSSGLSASADIENVDLALNIAQAKMEEIKNTAFASIAGSDYTADANFPRFSTRVVLAGSNPKQVDVTVKWNVKGEATTTDITLTTLVTNY